jgi:FHS family glucose/mannose:H+ symporter-like MFS transporter
MLFEEKAAARSDGFLKTNLRVGFFLIGIITVLLGQILPVLSSNYSLSDRDAGDLFIAQFAGSLTGTLFYSRIVRKFGYSKMLFGGFCLMAAGCASVNIGSFLWCAAAISIYGVGIGMTIPAINMLVVELDRERSASALSTINFFWGLGAILCKPFVDALGSRGSIAMPTIILAVLLFAIGIFILSSNYRESVVSEEISSGPSIPIWTSATAWLIAVFNFVHIGVESSMAGWITTYQNRLTQTATSVWISAAVVYFLTLVAGRAVAPFFFRRFSENAMIFGSLTLMTAGILLILATGSFFFLLMGSAIIGCGCSSVFPTNMSRFTKIFGSRSTQNATPIFVLGTLGGASITWLVGFTSTKLDNLRSGFLVVLMSCIVLVLLQTVLTVAAKKPRA